ncbi:MAG: hypothetical protein EP297_15800 [Gammaproteobacteria bacterium]|nr:MAG: hypothetical protein EP297_15800 [Gammaproteobacteria bacterium]
MPLATYDDQGWSSDTQDRMSESGRPPGKVEVQILQEQKSARSSDVHGRTSAEENRMFESVLTIKKAGLKPAFD